MFLTRLSPSSAYREAQTIAANIKSLSQQIHDKSASENISIEDLDGYVRVLNISQSRLSVLASTQGIGAYAQSQHTDVPSYDVAAEYTAMNAEISNCIAWIVANLPKDGSNYELAYTRDGSGNKVWRTFTPAQTAGFRTALTLLIQ
jgi:hypothetical protein